MRFRETGAMMINDGDVVDDHIEKALQKVAGFVFANSTQDS